MDEMALMSEMDVVCIYVSWEGFTNTQMNMI